MKKVRNMLALVLAIMMLAVVVAGCAGGTPPPAAGGGGADGGAAGGGAAGGAAGGGAPAGGAADREVFDVAFSVKDQTNPLFVDMVNGVRHAIDEYNAQAGYERIRLNVQAATDETRVEEQLTTHETFLAQGVHAIISTPLNSDAFVDFVLRCNQEGVAFINLDTIVNIEMMREIGAMFDVFIGGDNIWLGENVTKAMVEDFPDGVRYIVLGGNPGAATHVGMYRGYTNVRETMGPEFVRLAFELCNWQLTQALEVTTNLLPAHPDVQAIIAFNDQMAQGAISAIESFGLTPGVDIKVYGSNFVGNAPQFIYDGVQQYSQSRRPFYTGMLAAQAAINFINGVTPILDGIDEETKFYEFPGTRFRQGDFRMINGVAHDLDGNVMAN